MGNTTHRRLSDVAPPTRALAVLLVLNVFLVVGRTAPAGDFEVCPPGRFPAHFNDWRTALTVRYHLRLIHDATHRYSRERELDLEVDPVPNKKALLAGGFLLEWPVPPVLDYFYVPAADWRSYPQVYPTPPEAIREVWGHYLSRNSYLVSYTYAGFEDSCRINQATPVDSDLALEFLDELGLIADGVFLCGLAKADESDNHNCDWRCYECSWEDLIDRGYFAEKLLPPVEGTNYEFYSAYEFPTWDGAISIGWEWAWQIVLEGRRGGDSLEELLSTHPDFEYFVSRKVHRDLQALSDAYSRTQQYAGIIPGFTSPPEPRFLASSDIIPRVPRIPLNNFRYAPPEHWGEYPRVVPEPPEHLRRVWVHPDSPEFSEEDFAAVGRRPPPTECEIIQEIHADLVIIRAAMGHFLKTDPEAINQPPPSLAAMVEAGAMIAVPRSPAAGRRYVPATSWDGFPTLYPPPPPGLERIWVHPESPEYDAQAHSNMCNSAFMLR